MLDGGIVQAIMSSGTSILFSEFFFRKFEVNLRIVIYVIIQWSGLQCLTLPMCRSSEVPSSFLYSHATWAPRPMSTDNAHLMHHLVEFFLLTFLWIKCKKIKNVCDFFTNISFLELLITVHNDGKWHPCLMHAYISTYIHISICYVHILLQSTHILQ